MKNADVELIQRVLDGDDTAFSTLVGKYQRSVHALVWRKIGDFHIAEDITQETFLKAYQKLSELKEPQSFVSWLYVIAANRCKAWLRKKRVWTQSLESTSNTELEKATYSSYVIEENERTSAEAQREVVKKLLAKLQESDRTVITLYYLGGMTYEEISRFLGVSVSSIKNRLYRARQHLKKEEPMIREALENYQITPHLTEKIMQEIARLKPAAPSGSKPLVPWAITASSVVLIVLMLGIGSQHLVHFQKPYSLDAHAETTVELIDAPIVLNLDTNPDVRRQLGSSNAIGNNDNDGQKPDEVLLADVQIEGEEVYVPKQQWIQSEPIKGSPLMNMLGTPEGDVYVLGDELSFYKLPADGKQWQHISDMGSLDTWWTPRPPIAKWKNTLYMIPSNNLFVSINDGKTWDLLYSWQEEKYWTPIELVLTEDVFYVAFTSGILRSEDKGKTWEAMDKGLKGRISSLVKVQHVLFTATDTGLYRLNPEVEVWERLKLPAPEIGRIFSVAATEDKLYIAAEFSWDGQVDPRKVDQGLERGWWIFRSTDLGDSWKDIAPTNAWPIKGRPPEIELIAAGETLLTMENGMVRSTDGGDTWMPPQTPGTSPSTISGFPTAVLNERVFYVYSWDGLHRSTDGGKSWDKVNIPGEKEMSPIDNLIVYQENDKVQSTLPTLYARFGGEYWRLRGEIAKTTDKGKSWKTIQMEIPPITERDRKEQPSITQIVKSNGVIYAKGSNNGKTLLYRISTDGNKLVPIQDIPIFDSGLLSNYHLFLKHRSLPLEQEKQMKEELKANSFGAAQFFKQLAQVERQQQEELFDQGFKGPFAVSGDTFYMEYNFKLFRWKPGDAKWHDTGQEETVELTQEAARKSPKLAVSGNTVYVGKRDGHLVVSFDRGNNWIDLTPAMPFIVKSFKDIVFAGPTVYVATDTGIITSDDDRTWRVVTDAKGSNLVMEHLAADGATVYGVTKDTSIYRMENGAWKQVVSEIPDNVTSLAVDGDTLYVGTEYNEVLHFNLEE